MDEKIVSDGETMKIVSSASHCDDSIKEYEPKKRILIVDDSAFLRVKLKNILESGGYEVVGEAVDGLIAVDLFEKLKPDLVTLDITMPKMNGLEALKIIKMIDKNSKVIMCSAMFQEATYIESINNGAIDFIIKPFNEETILKTLAKILN